MIMHCDVPPKRTPALPHATTSMKDMSLGARLTLLSAASFALGVIFAESDKNGLVCSQGRARRGVCTVLMLCSALPRCFVIGGS